MKILQFITGKYDENEHIFPKIHITYSTIRDDSGPVCYRYKRRVILKSRVRRQHSDEKYYLADVSQWYDLPAIEIDHTKNSEIYEIEIAALAMQRLLSDAYSLMILPMVIEHWSEDEYHESEINRVCRDLHGMDQEEIDRILPKT